MEKLSNETIGELINLGYIVLPRGEQMKGHIGYNIISTDNPEYGFDAMCNDLTYGHEDGLYEIGILKRDEETLEYEFCFDTPIANNFIGYQSEEDIIKIATNLKDYIIAKNRNSFMPVFDER